MQECYHPDILFSDPVFTHLKGPRAGAMWHMLALAGKDLKITFTTPVAHGDSVCCDWQAWYTFSVSGRQVHNIIHAEFEFKDGKIIRHVDRFDLWRWTRMALGLSGVLLGWTPIIQSKIRQRAASNLGRFVKDNPVYE